MASKYINLEDAASQLSITTTELNRLREAGEIRAFADRGTWKFKQEDVETLARNLKPDSGYDIPRIEDEDDVIRLGEELDLGGGSQIVLEEEMGDRPTVISKKSPGMPPSSDSDVRLVVDPALESDLLAAPSLQRRKTEQQPPKTAAELPSDSELRLVEDLPAPPSGTPLRTESEDDSKVSLSDDELDLAGISDSDVRLVPIDDDAGSDITLQAESGIGRTARDKSALSEESESDVSLMGNYDQNPPSGLDLTGSGIVGEPGSEVTLMPLDDEGSAAHLLAAGDEDQEDSILGDMLAGPASGMSFSSGDSGISLDLAIDSGISLGGDDDDDSITLGADSGISLIPDSGLGLTLDDTYSRRDVGESTIPMLGISDDDDADTSFDMPLLEDSGAEVEQDDPTGVVMFDDEDSADTMEFDSSELEGDEFVDFDDEGSFDELSDSELDVSNELLDDDDVLEADDNDFEDDFESGESVASLPAAGTFRGGVAPAMAAEWDMVSFSLVLLSTVSMGICTLLMYDLVRSMWAHQSPIGVNGMILDALQGFIKS
ncbi:MAG: helix-turn-helix domain-containing protein [Planctomycetaceae bacterium]|nr:helix-turn-helix domain-containing protein [Planctomycetaceae bacterium]